jgi:hypothetical protein
MHHGKLRSVLGKLGILGVYILFLLVQLNLKYTLQNATGIHIASVVNSDQSNTKNCHYNSSREKKISLLQLRLNKRYYHQDVYQVVYQPKQIVVDFAIEPKQFIYQAPVLQDPQLLHSPLRGPPSA